MRQFSSRSRHIRGKPAKRTRMANGLTPHTTRTLLAPDQCEAGGSVPMHQYSTGLARRATGDAIDPQVPGLDPATAAPSQEGVAALHGVMTGLANLVNEQLGRLTTGPRPTRFFPHLDPLPFANPV